MRTRRASGRVVASGLALLAALWFFAAGGLAQTGTITLTVDCDADPERTTITNTTDQPLNVGAFRLASLYQPRQGESYQLTAGPLAPGESRTYLTGEGAPTGTPLTLTRQFIYENDAPSEGAGLTTPYGTLNVLCSQGTGTLQVRQPVQVTPTPVPAGAIPTATAVPPPATGDTIRLGTPVGGPRPTAAPSAAPGLPATGGGGGAGGAPVLVLLGAGVAGVIAVGTVRRARAGGSQGSA